MITLSTRAVRSRAGALLARSAPHLAVWAAVGASALGAAACSDAPATATAAAAKDAGAADASARSHFYTASLKFHGGKHDGRVISLDRDLGALAGVLSFGNTHLTPPAVALGLEDHLSQPITSATGTPTLVPLTLQLRLGILVEAPGFAAHTPQAGSYPFGCAAPLLQVVLDTELYRSTCPDRTGAIEVLQWSASPGGRVRGTFAGALGRHKTDPAGTDDCAPGYAQQACTYATPSWVEVSGQFDLVLPELNQD